MGRTWRIGEVAERTGLTRRTLRHYDELGLLVPSERSWGDYRLYDEADLLRLLQIQNLKALGLSLPEIGEALADPDLDASATLRSHLGHVEGRIAAEQALAGRLRTLAEASERSWEDVLATIALTRRLRHPDPTVRLRAALQSPGTTGDLFGALVAETDPGVREVLIWALAQQPEAGPAAVARLDDPDPDLRCLFVRLLAKLQDPAFSPALIARLADPAPAVVAAAVHALGQLRDPSALPALVGLIGGDAVPAPDLIDAVAGFGEWALDPLSHVLGSASADARAVAAEAAGRAGATGGGGERAARMLAPLLTDDAPQVRLSALLALGELGEPGRPAIAGLREDPQLGGIARRLLDLHAT